MSKIAVRVSISLSDNSSSMTLDYDDMVAAEQSASALAKLLAKQPSEGRSVGQLVKEMLKIAEQSGRLR